jgi:hypothetical protein
MWLLVLSVTAFWHRHRAAVERGSEGWSLS